MVVVTTTCYYLRLPFTTIHFLFDLLVFSFVIIRFNFFSKFGSSCYYRRLPVTTHDYQKCDYPRLPATTKPEVKATTCYYPRLPESVVAATTYDYLTWSFFKQLLPTTTNRAKDHTSHPIRAKTQCFRAFQPFLRVLVSCGLS